MQKEAKKNNCIFKHYFIMFFGVILIPMLICCVFYAYMFWVIGSDDIATRKKDLIHSATRFDTVVSEVNYLGDCLVCNEAVNRFQNLTDAMLYPNTYKINELQAALPDLYLVNQSIYDYYIFFNNSEVVINNKIAYSYEQFYNLYLGPKSIGSFEEWRAQLSENGTLYGFLPIEEYDIRTAGRTEKLLSYSRPLSFVPQNPKGYVYIYLKEDAIASIMPLLEPSSVQTIQDMSGKIIYCRDEIEDGVNEAELGDILSQESFAKELIQKTVRLRGDRYTFISFVSEESGLRYSYFVPQIVIYQRLFFCIAIFMIFALIGIFADFALSYHISMKNATPINDILAKMSIDDTSFDKHHDIFTSLKDSVDELIDNNTDLSNAISLQKPYLKTAFVNRILLSGVRNDKDIYRMADYLGWPIDNRVYCVLLFRFHLEPGGAGLDVSQRLISTFLASISELIERSAPGSLYTDLGEGQLALIMNEDADRSDDLICRSGELVKKLRQEMAPVLADKMIVYGGSIEHDFGRISDSYRNASYLSLSEQDKVQDHILWYDEKSHHTIGYPTDEMQVKLTHFVTSGDEKGLHDYLEGIIRKYYVETDLPVYLQHILIYDLQTILFRLLGIIKLEDDEYADYYSQLEQNYNKPVLDQITITLNLYTDMCHHINDQKNMQNADMIAGGVVSFIDTHYSDPDLSLTMLADEFGISQPYLSLLFKKEHGINISAYIENIRIEKAKDFLKTTELNVGKIGEMSGYSSTNSFCRAFKRVIGMSPSEYRQVELKV